MRSYIVNEPQHRFGTIIIQKKAQIAFPIFIALMLLLNYFTSNDYISLICTVVVFAYLLFCKRELLLPNMIFYSLFAYLFHYGDYALYVFVCIAFLFRVALIKKANFMLFIALFPVYLIMHLISTDFSVISIGDIVPFFSILCLLGACLVYNSSDREKCISYFIIGYVLSAVFGTLKSASRLAEVSHVTYTSVFSWQDTIRFAGISYDPNFFTVLSLIVLMLIMFSGIAKTQKVLTIVGLVTAIVAGANTYSKSFYILACLLVIVYLFGSQKKILKRVGIVLALAVLASLIFENEIYSILVNITSRFANVETMNDLTTGRSNLWIEYFKDIFSSISSFLFGNGIQRTGRTAAHNTYLELLYDFGLLGASFDILLLYLSTKSIRKTSVGNSLNRFGILFIFLLNLFALSAYSFPTLWTCIFLLILLLRTDGESNGTTQVVNSNPCI